MFVDQAAKLTAKALGLLMDGYDARDKDGEQKERAN